MPTSTTPAPRFSIPSLRGGDLVFREISRDASGTLANAWRPAQGRGILLRRLTKLWADQPVFVERLSRHALAIEQLDHPHLAKALGFGLAGGIPALAWEIPEGRRLSEIAEAGEPIEIREAVVLALQIARGLKVAHAEGLAHGGLDLGRIWLDEPTALVQVVGLGWIDPHRAGLANLVETEQDRQEKPTIDLVAFPENDLEADIEALGRVLYFLLTGRAADLDSRSVTAPDLIQPKLPRALSTANMRMIAPQKGDAFAGLDEVIEALERIIGAPKAEAFLPRAEAVETLEQAATEYRQAPTARLKSRVFGGFYATIAALVLLTFLLFPARLAIGLLGLGVLTALAYFIVHGFKHESPLFRRVSALLLGVSRKDALLVLIGFALIVGTLAVLGVLKAWIAFGLAGIILAIGAHGQLDRKLDQERRGPVEQVQRILRGLRVHGLDETAVRRFVRNHSGRDWPGIYEALFGFEALRAARNESKGREPANPVAFALPKLKVKLKVADWRDPISDAIDSRLRSRRRAEHWRQIQEVEERRLEAGGMYLLTARRRSWRIAEAMLARIDDWRTSRTRAGESVSAVPGGRPKLADVLRQALEVPEEVLIETDSTPKPGRFPAKLRRKLEDLASLLLGLRARFLVGAVLLAGCLAWVQQNRLVSGAEIQDLAARSLADPQESLALRDDLEVRGRTLLDEARGAEPLHLPPIPRFWTSFFRDFHSGVAGLILLLSVAVWGWRVGLFVFPAAAIALFGPALGVPALGPFGASAASLILALGLTTLGFLFGRES